MGKAFEKQIKTIEDQGKKQVDVLENLELKEETKPIEDKPNNYSRTTIIFNELINERKKLMSELYDSVDYNNLNFECVGPTKDVSFYEYKDYKEFFNAIKNHKTRFDEAVKKQDEFLKKLGDIKIGKKTTKQKGVFNNITTFCNSREETINFSTVYGKMILDAAHKTKQNKTEGTGLKLLTPKQMLQRLPMALGQVKAGTNSESLLNEIRQIVYSFYRSKQITKKVYNNIIRSINI